MKIRVTYVLLLLTAFASTAFAQSVPQHLSFTGNLTGSGGPVSGTHSFVFTLYDASTGGSSAWTEEQANLQVTNGVVFVDLGSVHPLTPAILDGSQVWLEVAVDSTTLSPRVAVQSVAYSVRSAVASSAAMLGTLLPSDLQRRVSGTCANGIASIDLSGNVSCATPSAITSINTFTGSGLTSSVNAGSATLSLASCPANQVLKSNGTTWSCQDATGGVASVSATANAGLVSGGTATNPTLGLPLSGCSSGFVMKWNGSAWACSAQAAEVHLGDVASVGVAAPVVNTGTSTAPVIGLASTVQNWASQPSCPRGKSLRGIAANGTPTCAAPALVDSYFFLTVNGPGGGYAAIFDNCKSSDCAAINSANVSGSGTGSVSSQHLATGTYLVSIPWLSSGVPQVTAWNDSGSIHCNFYDFTLGTATPYTATVTCFELFP